jgi:hypothetical protein
LQARGRFFLHLRHTLPPPPNPPGQIDALKLEPFIDSFVEGLGLDQGYTMVVVNGHPAETTGYAFRAGFSADEVQILQEEVGPRRGGPTGARL